MKMKYETAIYEEIDEVGVITLNRPEARNALNYPLFLDLDDAVRGIIVMSKGPRGVEVSDGKTRYTAGIPDSPVVDRTGAGDAFGSGFTSGYIHSDGDMEFAIQLGTANATSVVQYFGGQQGTLKKDEWGDYPKVEVDKSEL